MIAVLFIPPIFGRCQRAADRRPDHAHARSPEAEGDDGRTDHGVAGGPSAARRRAALGAWGPRPVLLFVAVGQFGVASPSRSSPCGAGSLSRPYARSGQNTARYPCFTGRRHRAARGPSRMPRRQFFRGGDMFLRSRRLRRRRRHGRFPARARRLARRGQRLGIETDASTDKVILFASDGMRPDLMEEYARHGSMPTYKSLIHQGVRGHNGLTQGFPPNTGVGWATLATGAWPGVHGSTNNTFHRLTDPSFNSSTSFAAPGCSRLTRSARRPSARQGRRLGRVGRGPRLRRLRSRGRSWISGRSSRGADPAQLRHPGPARPGECVRRRLPPGHARSGDRLDERAHLVQPGQGGAADGHDDLRSREPDEALRPLHLRLDERQHR